MKVHKESIGRLISILYRSGQNHIGRQLEPYGVGAGQFAFLAELFQKDGVSQDELASFFRCDRATATRALQRLESQGYVIRKKSEEDGRVNLVYLTDKAHLFQPTLYSVLSGWTEKLAEGFSDDEKRLLITLLTRLVKNTVKTQGPE